MDSPAKKSDKEKKEGKDLLKIPRLGFFKINLLVQKNIQPKIYIRFLRWILSSGKFIVIAVELLTISAFIYRYKLDSELIDVQEKIKEITPFVQSLNNNEILIRQTQFQLQSIHQIKNSSPDFDQIFSKIALLTPQSIRLTNISLESSTPGKNDVTIAGITPSNFELSTFIKTLQLDPLFSHIALTNISFEGETSFIITGNLNMSGGKRS